MQITSSAWDISASDVCNDNEKKTPCTSQTAAATVCFAEQDNVVYDILPLSEYTPEEIRSCWFTRGEYNSFKRNSLVTLSLNRAGELSPDDPEHTMRGLECRTRECTDSRRMMRYRATAAVFDEQARQQNLGICDPEALSEKYHTISWHSMYDAHTQGMADEQDSQALLLEGAAAAEDRLLLAAPRRASSKKRNTVLSKVISIERNDAFVLPAVPSTSSLVAGLDCDLWSNTYNANNTSPASFNLNSFFNEMSLGIAVAAA